VGGAIGGGGDRPVRVSGGAIWLVDPETNEFGEKRGRFGGGGGGGGGGG
jgi:hypothetical protein